MKTRNLAVILIAVLSLSGCSFLFNRVGQSGTLVLSIPDATDNQKSLGPSIDFRMTAFDISGIGPEDATFEILNYTSGNVEKTALAIGYWTIQVLGKNTEGVLIGTGSASVEVQPSTISHVTIELAPITGNGTFEINLDLQDLSIASAVFETSLVSLDGTVSQPGLINVGSLRKLSLELASGFYSFMVRALVDGVPSWGIEESVIILKDQVTKADYILDSTAVNKRPATPSNLSAVWNSDQLVELRWKDNTVIETGYILQRKEEGEAADFKTIVTLRENSSSYKDSGPFTRGKRYDYRIIAAHPRQDSEPSTETAILVPMAVEVSGKLTKSQVWTTGNEYLITSSVLVPTGMTLKIEPGVVVLFQNSEYYVKVDGTILCEGSATQPIRFLGKNGSTWQGLKITTLASGSLLSNTHFYDGNVSIDSGAAIEQSIFTTTPITVSNGAAVTILDSTIKYGITNSGGSLIIKNCEISNVNGTAISYTTSGSLWLEDNIIKESQSGLVTNWVPGSITLLSNSFRDISSRAVELNGYHGELTMDSNEILSCGTAIYAYYYFPNYTITNNYLYKNAIFFHLYEMQNPWGGTVRGNVIDNCTGEAAILLEGNINLGMYNVVFSSNTFHNPNAEYEVKLRDSVTGSGSVLNLKNNYWGTSDLNAIQTRIYDSNVDFELLTVEFDPPAGSVQLAATLVSPENNLEVTSSSPLLRWKVNGWSPSFKLQVSDDPSFSTVLIEKSALPERSIFLVDEALYSRMTNGSTYYWRVAPELQDGSYGTYSDPYAFIVKLPVPSTVSPANDSRLYQGWNPLLEWRGSDEFNTYRVQLDDSSDFSSPVIETDSPSKNYQTPFILPEGTTYYWRVKGRDLNGTWGEYSPISTFRIPLPGIGLEIETDLPGQVSLAINGPDQGTTMGGQSYSFQSNVSPSEIEWSINGEVTGYGSSFLLPELPKGTYTLGVRIQWKNRSYSASKICKVVSMQEVMP
jgi:hypothetical protein